MTRNGETPKQQSPLVGRALVRKLGVGDGQRTVIDHVDFQLHTSEFVSITGPSGSGKSTLLYLLGALDKPDEGEVWIEGQPTSQLSQDARALLRGEKIGFVFQSHFLLPEFSALENVMIPMWKLARHPRNEIEVRARKALCDLGLEEFLSRKPRQLSGGQQQRVSIARAIAHGPRICLADEPTGNLDTKSGEVVIEILERLARKEGMSVVIVTHELSYAKRADREIQLRDGRIVQDATSGPSSPMVV